MSMGVGKKAFVKGVARKDWRKLKVPLHKSRGDKGNYRKY